MATVITGGATVLGVTVELEAVAAAYCIANGLTTRAAFQASIDTATAPASNTGCSNLHLQMVRACMKALVTIIDP